MGRGEEIAKESKSEWPDMLGQKLKGYEVMGQEKRVFLEGISDQLCKILLRVFEYYEERNVIIGLGNMEDIGDPQSNYLCVSCLKNA